MGIYDRSYYREDEQSGFSLGNLTGGRPVVINLIILNFVVFVLDAVFGVSGSGLGRASEFLSLEESNFQQPWYWWRLLTYGFAHGSPSHLIGNMIGLFFFGRAAEAVCGSEKRFLWMYASALVVCSSLWLLSTQVTPSPRERILLGASGGVVACVILFCLHFPHQKITLLFLPFVGIPAWVIGLLYVGSDLLGVMGHQHGQAGGAVAYSVHLIGAAYAYVYFRSRWDLSQIFNTGWISGAKKSLTRPKLKVHDPDGKSSRSRGDDLEKKADVVLKKLHEKGESSLSASERSILEEYSRSIKQRNR